MTFETNTVFKKAMISLAACGVGCTRWLGRRRRGSAMVGYGLIQASTFTNKQVIVEEQGWEHIKNCLHQHIHDDPPASHR